MYIGIDISKLSFDVAILKEATYYNQHFTNDCAGLKHA